MSVISAFVLYAVLWFLTLFVILPIRLKTQGDLGEIIPGTPAGAPENPQIRKRALITTGVAFVLWVAISGIIISGVISLRDLDVLDVMGPATEAGEINE